MNMSNRVGQDTQRARMSRYQQGPPEQQQRPQRTQFYMPPENEPARSNSNSTFTQQQPQQPQQQQQMNTLPEQDVVLRDAVNELFYLLNTTKSKSNSNRRIHSGVDCKFCLTKNIEGDRYLCTVCDNYNLCSDCFCSRLVNEDHLLEHPVLCIANPVQEDGRKTSNAAFMKRTRLDQLVQTYANLKHPDNLKCNMCRKPLVGVRLKCDVCYDLDLCYPCWYKRQHDAKHPFIIFTEPVIKQISFDQIEFDKKLGAGAFGSVYQAYVKPSRNLVACKTVENNRKTNGGGGNHADDGQQSFENCLKSIQDEINAHYEIRSAYVCKLFAYARENQRLCLVLEFMDNGTLEDLINRENRTPALRLPLIRKLKIMGDVATGLYDIHKKNFVHCDIKPDNILLNSDFTAKISDLGIIKNRNVKNNDGMGNVFYLPSEFFTNKYDNTVDVFSFGLVTYHLFSGHRHELNEQNEPVLRYLEAIKLEFVKDLVLMATSRDPAKRMPIDFYRTMLRNYTSVSDHYFQLDEIALKLRNQPTEAKDDILIALNKYFMNVVRAKMRLKTSLVRRGLSTKEINSPEIDALLNKIASTFKVNQEARQQQERNIGREEGCCSVM